MEWLTKIGEVFKLPTKVYAIVALTTGLALFLPASILEKLKLDAIPTPWGTIAGVVFLVSLSMVIANGVAWVIRKQQARQKAAARAGRVLDKLTNLDTAEQGVLREFVVFGRSTIRLPMDNPTVAGLIASGVIQQTGNLGHQTVYGMLFSFRLSDDTQLLMPEGVLGIPVEFMPTDGDGRPTLSEQGARWVRENRPAFIHDIEYFESPVHRRW